MAEPTVFRVARSCGCLSPDRAVDLAYQIYGQEDFFGGVVIPFEKAFTALEQGRACEIDCAVQQVPPSELAAAYQVMETQGLLQSIGRFAAIYGRYIANNPRVLAYDAKIAEWQAEDERAFIESMSDALVHALTM